MSQKKNNYPKYVSQLLLTLPSKCRDWVFMQESRYVSVTVESNYKTYNWYDKQQQEILNYMKIEKVNKTFLINYHELYEVIMESISKMEEIEKHESDS